MIDETELGKLVCDIVSIAMLQNSRGNYDLSEYINNFNGTQEELNVALIKLAAKELDTHKYL